MTWYGMDYRTDRGAPAPRGRPGPDDPTRGGYYYGQPGPGETGGYDQYRGFGSERNRGYDAGAGYRPEANWGGGFAWMNRGRAPERTTYRAGRGWSEDAPRRGAYDRDYDREFSRGRPSRYW